MPLWKSLANISPPLILRLYSVTEGREKSVRNWTCITDTFDRWYSHWEYRFGILRTLCWVQRLTGSTAWGKMELKSNVESLSTRDTVNQRVSVLPAKHHGFSQQLRASENLPGAEATGRRVVLRVRSFLMDASIKWESAGLSRGLMVSMAKWLFDKRVRISARYSPWPTLDQLPPRPESSLEKSTAPSLSLIPFLSTAFYPPTRSSLPHSSAPKLDHGYFRTATQSKSQVLLQGRRIATNINNLLSALFFSSQTKGDRYNSYQADFFILYINLTIESIDSKKEENFIVESTKPITIFMQRTQRGIVSKKTSFSNENLTKLCAISNGILRFPPAAKQRHVRKIFISSLLHPVPCRGESDKRILNLRVFMY